jgi:DNA-binding MarR family transcriptional regulator
MTVGGNMRGMTLPDGQLEAKKRASTAQLLFKCARLVNDRAIARLRAETGLPVRAAHTLLFPHLDFQGVRLTELAEKLGVTKQAVGQLVDELEQMGAVERIADPRDGRAKLIRFGERGREGMLHGLSVLGEIERDLACAIGDRLFAALHDALLVLADHLEAG